MAAIINPSLFSWKDVEARSDLDRFYLVRDNLPDEDIIRELEDLRGNGRDDFSIRAMWNGLIGGVVFQHESVESLIRELSRNPALLEACGFDVLPRQKKAVALFGISALVGVIVFLIFVAVGASLSGDVPPLGMREIFAFGVGAWMMLILGLGSNFTDFARGYVIAVCYALGFSGTVLMSNPRVFLVPGSVIVLMGLVVFTRFLRKYPTAPRQSATNND